MKIYLISSFVLLMFLLFSCRTMHELRYEINYGELDYIVTIYSKSKPYQISERTFRVSPEDIIFIKTPCFERNMKAIIIKGNPTLGLPEDWAFPYRIKDNSVMFRISDIACPKIAKNVVYHETNKVYVQFLNCDGMFQQTNSIFEFQLEKNIYFCE